MIKIQKQNNVQYQLSRVRSFQVAISSGLMTPNEARAKMDLEPYAGGDKFYLGLQGAMVDPTIEPLGIVTGKLRTLLN